MNLSSLTFKTERVNLEQGDTHCGCGVWRCSSLVARVVFLKDDIVEWSVKDLRHPKNSRKYYFARAEYEKIMAQVCIGDDSEVSL